MKIRHLLVLFILSLFLACQGERPDGIMSPSEMKKFLYDYHVAQGLGNMEYGDSADYKRKLYIASVFKKYDLTPEDFDKNLHYYAKHMDEFHAIYKSLMKDFGENGENGEMPMTPLPQKDNGIYVPVKFAGEQTNAIVLTAQGRNRAYGEVVCDSTFHAGDELELQLMARALYPEGEKRSTVVMKLHYENDSTQTVANSVSGFGLQTLRAMTSENLKLKKIDVFIQQNAPWMVKNCILSFSDIRIKVMHKIKAVEKPTLQTDSVGVSDSLIMEENLKKIADTLGQEPKKP